MDQKKDVNLKRCPHTHWLKYSKVMQAIAEVCCLCNESRIDARDGVFRAVGAPTEAALVVLAEKLGVPDPEAQERIRAQRATDPERHADGTAQYYATRCGCRFRNCAGFKLRMGWT